MSFSITDQRVGAPFVLADNSNIILDASDDDGGVFGKIKYEMISFAGGRFYYLHVNMYA